MYIYLYIAVFMSFSIQLSIIGVYIPKPEALNKDHFQLNRLYVSKAYGCMVLWEVVNLDLALSSTIRLDN